MVRETSEDGQRYYSGIQAHALRCPECGFVFGGVQVAIGSELIVTLDGRNSSVHHTSRRDVRFTATESIVIATLASSGGRVLTRRYVYEQLYWDRPEHAIPDPKILDVLICKVRAKLESYKLPVTIETVWGRGWILRTIDDTPTAAAPV